MGWVGAGDWVGSVGWVVSIVKIDGMKINLIYLLKDKCIIIIRE